MTISRTRSVRTETAPIAHSRARSTATNVSTVATTKRGQKKLPQNVVVLLSGRRSGKNTAVKQSLMASSNPRAQAVINRLNRKFLSESGFDIPDITNVKSVVDAVERARREILWFSDWARQTIDAMMVMVAEEVVAEENYQRRKRGKDKT